MRFTLVSFHAHPDDEVLLTGGTLAKAAKEGHRVVLVVATSGEAGLAATDLTADGNLGSIREHELRGSAKILGCERVIFLGYADSGLHAEQTGAAAFSSADPQVAARRLAAILDEERADALTIYDPAGGYGHPDHRQVHVVGSIAASMAGTPLVLEATVDRGLIARIAWVLRLIPGGLGGVRYADMARSYTARAAITHRVDVRAHALAKREAMRAHASQATADGGPRTLSMLLRLPMPLFRLLLGHEWFVEHGRPEGPLSGDIFDRLRA